MFSWLISLFALFLSNSPAHLKPAPQVNHSGSNTVRPADKSTAPVTADAPAVTDGNNGPQPPTP